MRSKIENALEDGRLRFGDSPKGANYGAFEITGPTGSVLRIISSGSDSKYGWEHVSVSTMTRCPIWEEMCFVKNLFWSEDECVIQFHPPADQYVNCHPYCLHMWRPLKEKLPTPPSLLVGPTSGT